jgi:hypothetical protein
VTPLHPGRGPLPEVACVAAPALDVSSPTALPRAGSFAEPGIAKSGPDPQFEQGFGSQLADLSDAQGDESSHEPGGGSRAGLLLSSVPASGAASEGATRDATPGPSGGWTPEIDCSAPVEPTQILPQWQIAAMFGAAAGGCVAVVGTADAMDAACQLLEGDESDPPVPETEVARSPPASPRGHAGSAATPQELGAQCVISQVGTAGDAAPLCTPTCDAVLLSHAPLSIVHDSGAQNAASQPTPLSMFEANASESKGRSQQDAHADEWRCLPATGSEKPSGAGGFDFFQTQAPEDVDMSVRSSPLALVGPLCSRWRNSEQQHAMLTLLTVCGDRAARHDIFWLRFCRFACHVGRDAERPQPRRRAVLLEQSWRRCPPRQQPHGRRRGLAYRCSCTHGRHASLQ